jgi:redox-sensitive bicupin YhaK (pirin superfamily)
MGSVEVLRPGEVQRMSAGAGVTHSEYNHSATEPVHLLQIWITPERKGLKPAYGQRRYDSTNQLRLVASQDGRNDSLTINQDAALYVGKLAPGTTVTHSLPKERHAWIQVATGTVELNGQRLTAGDGAALGDETVLNIIAKDASEVLVFDLA